ncbi:hypothetical protein [Streptomyces sp. DASNCL29]|uniref:hypothetical protein n=1 Tax=Streptomyces sp. DASNCL29 TaxID=2583819 RepID=UPI0023F4D564|nr:hypothetical protein [Streptomyces sp. DASNCL29]
MLVGLTVPLAVASPAAAYDDPAHAYVTNNSGDGVSVIDTKTNAVTTTIPVGDEPNGVAITPRTVVNAVPRATRGRGAGFGAWPTVHNRFRG